MIEQIRFNALQTRLCRPVVFRFHAESQVLSLAQTVAALGKLVLQHFCVFAADCVEAVRLVGKQNALPRLNRTVPWLVRGLHTLEMPARWQNQPPLHPSHQPAC